MTDRIEQQGGTFRGYAIRREPIGEFVFADTGLPTVSTWQERPCGACGLPNTPEGHDGCLGTLPGVLNACCGHGQADAAYVQLANGDLLGGSAAVAWFSVARVRPDPTTGQG